MGRRKNKKSAAPKNKFLKFCKAVYEYIRDFYALLAERKYSTVAGTLVFFLIMSVIPFAFWLTLLFGKLDGLAEKVLALPVFSSVKEILMYIREEARTAASGASVFLIVTTLYSATGLFYHMRKSGELIYGYQKKKQGWKVRLSAVLLLFAVMLLSAAALAIFAGGAFLFSRFLPEWAEILADYILLFVLSFGLVLLLNLYICPYKAKLSDCISGTLLTVAAWAVALLGFAVYLRLSNVSKLYGALSAVIVFLLWLYVMMICFVAGVIWNSRKAEKRQSKVL